MLRVSNLQDTHKIRPTCNGKVARGGAMSAIKRAHEGTLLSVLGRLRLLTETPACAGWSVFEGYA